MLVTTETCPVMTAVQVSADLLGRRNTNDNPLNEKGLESIQNLTGLISAGHKKRAGGVRHVQQSCQTSVGLLDSREHRRLMKKDHLSLRSKSGKSDHQHPGCFTKLARSKKVWPVTGLPNNYREVVGEGGAFFVRSLDNRLQSEI